MAIRRKKLNLMSQVVLTKGIAKDWLNNPANVAHHLTAGRWEHAPHLDYISNEVAQLEHAPIFLIITLPPRHGKSELISHWTPVWFLKRWPYKRIILASYQAGFAADWGGLVKNSFIEHRDQLGLTLAQDTKAKDHWNIHSYGGGMVATGIMGAITGRGGDLLIIDDPIKSQKEALSETYRRSIKQWYQATFRTRAEPGCSIVILMTRWHDDDLAGWLMKETNDLRSDLPRDPWRLINIKAVADEGDILGRKPGEALWPRRYPYDELMKLKGSIGSYWYAAEYEGNPIVEGGNIIRQGWFGYFDGLDYDPERTIQVWDTAYEEGKQNNRTACLTLSAQRYFDVLDVWAERVEFPDLVQMLKAKYYQYKPNRVYVEAKASGKSLVQQIKKDTNIPVIQIIDNDSKLARLHSISGIVESGKVRLRAGASWLDEFMHEVTGFPTAELDDITDTFSHALRIIQSFSTEAMDEPHRQTAKRTVLDEDF